MHTVSHDPHAGDRFWTWGKVEPSYDNIIQEVSIESERYSMRKAEAMAIPSGKKFHYARETYEQKQVVGSVIKYCESDDLGYGGNCVVSRTGNRIVYKDIDDYNAKFEKKRRMQKIVDWNKKYLEEEKNKQRALLEEQVSPDQKP